MDELRFSLRIPIELHRRLKAVAKNNHRSINSEILFILEEQLNMSPDYSTETQNVRGGHQGSRANEAEK